MSQSSPLIITISHQFGSGGAYLGQRLAEKLNILYVDRQIIDLAAKKLNTYVDEVECRDEKLSSFWQSLVQSCAFINSNSYIPPETVVVTNRQIYNAQAEVIRGIANEKSAVIIGRCASYILRDHPKHVSIFLHADIVFRQNRIQQMNNLSAEEALKLVKATDKARAQYIHELTKQELEDARQYHMSLDTGVLGLDETEKIVLSYLNSRFVI